MATCSKPHKYTTPPGDDDAANPLGIIALEYDDEDAEPAGENDDGN